MLSLKYGVQILHKKYMNIKIVLRKFTRPICIHNLWINTIIINYVDPIKTEILSSGIV